MAYTISIPDWRPLSVNTLLRMHPKRRMRLKRLDYHMVAAYCCVAEVPKATGKRRLSWRVEMRGGGAIPDRSNLLKSLEDALVACGMLVDDSPAWLAQGTEEVVRAKQTRTVIVLEDVT